MVLLIATAFFAFADNTEDEDERWTTPEGQFIYSVQVEMDGMTYDGTEVCDTMGSNERIWENETFGEMLQNLSMPSSLIWLHVSSTGIIQVMIDKVQLDTSWGVKKLDRGIVIWPDMEGGFLF